MSSNSSTSETLRRYASMLGSTGIAAGAFGAHALKETLAKRGSLPYWQTAVMYHLIHATALLGLSSLARDEKNSEKKGKNSSNYGLAGNLLMVGTSMFSGSLYMLALGIGPRALWGPTTPLGGALMIGGWVVLGVHKGY